MNSEDINSKIFLFMDLSLIIQGGKIESRSGLCLRRVSGKEATTGQRMRSYNDFRFKDFHLHEKRQLPAT